MDLSFNSDNYIGSSWCAADKSVLFPGLSVSLPLSCFPPALSVNDSFAVSQPLMSQRQDIYSSVKLPAVLIIPAQAAAGNIGCLSG